MCLSVRPCQCALMTFGRALKTHQPAAQLAAKDTRIPIRNRRPFSSAHYPIDDNPLKSRRKLIVIVSNKLKCWRKWKRPRRPSTVRPTARTVWTIEHFEDGGRGGVWRGLDNVRVIGYVKCKRRNTNSITNIACIMNLWVNCENLNSSASRVSWSPFRVLCVLSGMLLRAGWQAMYLMPRKWSSPATTTTLTAGCYSFQMQINEQQLAREEDKRPICNKSIRRASVSLSLCLFSLFLPLLLSRHMQMCCK